MAISNNAKFSIGEVVKHRHFDFRGVIYDVDFEFNNSEEWYQSIQKKLDLEKISHFTIYWLRVMTLLMKLMCLNKIYY